MLFIRMTFGIVFINLGFTSYFLYNVYRKKIPFDLTRYYYMTACNGVSLFMMLAIHYNFSRFHKRVSEEYFGKLTDDQIANFDRYKSWYKQMQNNPTGYKYPNVQN